MTAPILKAGNLRLVLAPERGGSIARFDWHDGETVVPILRGNDAPASPLEAASFPLVPFCNRIRGGRFVFQGREVRLAANMAGDANPLHGQGWLERWDLTDAKPDYAALRFHHAPGEWPWEYEAHQSFTLRETSLEIVLSCTNLSDLPMPCGLGQHPYFPCSGQTSLIATVSNVWTVDDDVLPLDRIPAKAKYALDGPVCGRGLDNGYDGWAGVAEIETPGAPFRLRLSSPDAAFFQLYSPIEGGLFVAEPVTHANAALNVPEAEYAGMGLHILGRGEAMTLRMTLEASRI